jgi:G:T-mismatch repair DNA endonuclease (very short patch repair protein)
MARAKTLKEYKEDISKVWGDLYLYNFEGYKSGNSKIKIYCHKHGHWFEKKAKVHINNKQGCPKCGRESSIRKQTKSTENVKKEIIQKFGDIFILDEIDYKSAHKKIKLICKTHGAFHITHHNLMKSQKGCPKCSFENMSSSLDEFKKRARDVHGTNYKYNGEYTNNKTETEIECPVHGSFHQRPDSHLNGHGCPKCYKNVSKAEIEIGDFITSLGYNIKTSDKKVLGGLELDIVIPSKKIAIEYNGLFWHREGLYKPVRKGKDKNYHLNKTKSANEKGYKLIQIFEDEWINKKSIVISKLKHILGVSNAIKIYARKTKIKLIDSKISRDFLNENHIQGSDTAGIRYGAYYGNELVGVMTFLKSKDKVYKLNRYATNSQYICVGLASKLFKHFTRNNDVSKVITFADKRWTSSAESNLYTAIGFKLISHTTPAYHYYNVDSQEPIRHNRQKFMKHKILKKYPEFSKDMTEKQMMIQLGYDRIWDCGNFKYEYIV